MDKALAYIGWINRLHKYAQDRRDVGNAISEEENKEMQFEGIRTKNQETYWVYGNVWGYYTTWEGFFYYLAYGGENG